MIRSFLQLAGLVRSKSPSGSDDSLMNDRDLDGLLGRKPVNLDTPELQRFLAGKRVMVTGAGGSIGSEICRQAMKFCPSRLILVEQAENALFEIDRRLRERWVGADITPYIADITDAARIEQVFAQERPQVIFHAAAHKHVPMMEQNPGEAVKNNVLGTQVLADAALKHQAAAFVMVSTDKAVNPTSVMGATKRVAELYVQGLNNRQQTASGGQPDHHTTDSHHAARCLLPTAGSSPTRFVAVRFGNVLGSSGSVVPIFQRQIDAGGPVTVTHPEMRRFFMTIPEASQLVMQAGAIGNGGEIFVLDMGKPLRILDLARRMIQLRGLEPEKDIPIVFTGIRPGEKLYEELAGAQEQTCPTSHSRIRVWRLPPATFQQGMQAVELLRRVVNGSRDDVVGALMSVVPEYAPSNPPTVQPAPPATTNDQASRLRLLALRASSRAA